MPRFALIGYPIEHSLSPKLFAAAYSGRFQYDLVQTSDLEKAWGIFLEKYDAINITSPFKERALERADIVSPEALRVGAANICVKTPEGIVAYNSDYLGLKQLLTELLFGGRVEQTMDLAEFGKTFGNKIISGQAFEASSENGRNTRQLQDASSENRIITRTSQGAEGQILAEGALENSRISGQAPEVSVKNGRIAGFYCGEGNQLISEGVFSGRKVEEISAAIIGFGGAGKAAKAAAEDIGLNTKLFRHGEISDGVEADIIIYTLPQWVEGADKLSCQYLLEANYKDPVLSSQSGYISGRQWLLHQALTGYQLMTGVETAQHKSKQ